MCNREVAPLMCNTYGVVSRVSKISKINADLSRTAANALPLSVFSTDLRFTSPQPDTS